MGESEQRMQVHGWKAVREPGQRGDARRSHLESVSSRDARGSQWEKLNFFCHVA